MPNDVNDDDGRHFRCEFESAEGFAGGAARRVVVWVSLFDDPNGLALLVVF